ncbi:hypothetical protein ND861_05550 [Leptospira sp. 2 VSF19]|uniref:Uncharacterized protein n=1 Tax=Leptospira soteropolitanensis TaxID=2950025 RepID=A0AAW5VKC1_9LEPT|nr:hypothetical protein [Leptospira soteropolitanensis]MCW7492118.1 hypothetical protein [Leptospira soteropolitanensis]MCW7499700.1 hypothetical protein [Leptospira soteropolitanensis]MCW7521951.1 hypothetical protein [Leptospira soteropolitanensis]MCW7525805.1 hypothetical protein [Leptospira soteropolitanensis]MCW7530081.1 hypothetical protein [Leptospira soteropolitanensis]
MIFKRKWYFPVMTLFFSTSFGGSLLAQVSGYESAYPSAYLLGLSSSGVVSSQSLGSIYGNTAFLTNQSKHLIDGGINGSYANPKISPLYLSGAAYYSYSDSLGFGFRGKPIFLRSFPTDERFSNYAFQGFINWKWNENLSFGLQLGPGVSSRIGGYSSYSWNVSASAAFQYGDFRLGVILESPGTYRFDKYLKTEKLKERLPERLLVGLGYRINEWIDFQMEGNRTFYENSHISLNGKDSSFQYPIHTMYAGNIGLAIGKIESFQFISGFGREFRAENSLRGFYTVSMGMAGSIFPKELGEGYLYSVSVQRSGLGVPERDGAETRAAFQIQIQFQ